MYGGNLLMQTSTPLTEQVDTSLCGFDTWSPAQMAHTFLAAQTASLAAVMVVEESIARASVLIAQRLRHSQGRLLYVGAGSAGMQACIDGVELPATFGWPYERLGLVLAGGLECLLHDKGQVEDDTEAATKEVQTLKIQADDVIIAVTASGSTPYTLTVSELAKQQGALVIGVTNTSTSLLQNIADHTIGIESGMEIVAGSTRMVAGTTQKMVLNTLSTLVMAQLGYLYDNLMVNMRVTNKKLRKRAVDITQRITGEHDLARIENGLEQANYHIPLAVLCIRGVERTKAESLLTKYNNQLRAALAEIGCSHP